MRPVPSISHSAKTCLSSGFLRPPRVCPSNEFLLLRPTRLSLRPSISSLHRSFALSSRSFQQPIRRTDHDRKLEEKTKLSVDEKPQAVRVENIWTIPNVLTISRILSCPVLGYAILHDNFHVATGLLLYAGLTDLVRAPFSSPVTGGCSPSTGSGRWLLGAEV